MVKKKIGKKVKKVKKTTKKESDKIKKNDPPDEWIRVSEWAERYGCKPAYCYRLVHSGNLGKGAKKNEDGKWRVLYPYVSTLLPGLQKAHQKNAAATVRKTKTTEKKKDEGKEITDSERDRHAYEVSKATLSRNEKEKYAAKNEKLKFERTAGLLIEKKFVSNGIKDISRIIRNKILSLPPRVSAEIAALDIPRDIEIYLSTEINAILTELSENLMELDDDLAI